jgi:hypothetical protein
VCAIFSYWLFFIVSRGADQSIGAVYLLKKNQWN